jgi:hypothetical protein
MQHTTFGISAQSVRLPKVIGVRQMPESGSSKTTFSCTHDSPDGVSWVLTFSFLHKLYRGKEQLKALGHDA